MQMTEGLAMKNVKSHKEQIDKKIRGVKLLAATGDLAMSGGVLIADAVSLLPHSCSRLSQLQVDLRWHIYSFTLRFKEGTVFSDRGRKIATHLLKTHNKKQM